MPSTFVQEELSWVMYQLGGAQGRKTALFEKGLVASDLVAQWVKPLLVTLRDYIGAHVQVLAALLLTP